MKIKQQLHAYIRSSKLLGVLARVSDKLSAFFAEGFFWRWFTSAPVPKASRGDRLLARFLASGFCEFIRSSALLGLLARVPELAWVFLILTSWSALLLPTMAVMLLSLITLALTAVGVIFRKERVPHLGSGMAMWALFALITLVYTVFNYGGLRGLLSGGIRFCMLPLMPCAFILLSRHKRVRRTQWMFSLGVLGIGIYGLYQFFAGRMSSLWTDTELFSEDFGRLTSTFENPNVYGTFLLLGLPIVLISAFTAKGGWERLFYIVTAAVAMINFVLTYSRGCYVSMVLILLILLICYGRRWLWAGVGLLAALPFVLPSGVLARVMSIGNLADSSVSYRISIWKGAWRLLEKYWWMGVGIGDTAFERVYSQTALEGISAPHAHNLLAQITCESGILGAAVLVGLFVCVLRTAMSATTRERGRAKWLRLTLIACWIGLLVQGVTDYIFYNNNLFAIMMISLGAMFAPSEGGEGNGK